MPYNTFTDRFGTIHAMAMIQTYPYWAFKASCGLEELCTEAKKEYEWPDPVTKSGYDFITCERCSSLIKRYWIDKYWRAWLAPEFDLYEWIPGGLDK